jgi:hypothetical protein
MSIGATLFEELPTHFDMDKVMDAATDDEIKARAWEKLCAADALREEALQRAMGTLPSGKSPSAASQISKAIDIQGDITPGELAALKAKYGNSLVSVRTVDPNDMQGHLYTAVWEETRDKAMEIVWDASLVGYYHLNRPQLSEFPFDPVQSYVPIALALGFTDANERTIRERFHVSDADIVHVRQCFDNMKQQLEGTTHEDRTQNISFFGQIQPKEITIVDAYDSVDRVTVFATGVRLPIGRGAFMMADACINCCKHVIRALMKSNPARAKKALRYRLAWHQPPRSDLMGIYAAFVDDVSETNTQDATEQAAVMALAQMIDKTQLFESPTANFGAALQAIADVSVPVQEAMENTTYKPPGSDVSPF